MKSFIRRLAILDYLRSAKTKKSTDEILQHLLNSDYFESCQDNDRTLTDSAVRRTIQRDMNFLYGGSSTSVNRCDDQVYNEFGLEVERGSGKSLVWVLDPYSNLTYDFEKMPSYLALSFAMTQKHLSGIMPKNTLHELEHFFNKADSKLQKEEATISPQQYRRLKESVEFYQRGQRLQAANYDIDVLDTIYRAILKGRQLSFNYRGKSYRVHPFGVVILLPKLYFVAKKDADISSPDGFRNFLIHKITDLVVLQHKAEIPVSFSLKSYLDKGNMDVYVASEDKQTYSFKLEIKTHSTSNLIEDLTENPISVDQELIEISHNTYELTASVKRTVQLKNWIMGLGSIATVLEPQVICHDIYTELTALLTNYKDNTNCLD